MAFQGISTGSGPNLGDGDTLFDGAVKINSNFSEVYNALGNGSIINSTIEPDDIDTGSINATSLTVVGIVTLGNDFEDSIFLNGGIGSNIVPTADDTYNLGTSTRCWKDLYVDGTGFIDTVSATDVQTDTLTANGNVVLGNEFGDTVTIPGVLDVNGKANIDDVEISGTSIRCTATSSNLILNNNGTGSIVLQGGGITVDNDGNVSTDGSITLGNYFGVAGTDLDTVTFNSRIDSSILPNGTDTYPLGTGLQRWIAVHAKDGYFDKVQTDSNVTISGNLTVDETGSIKTLSIGEDASITKNLSVGENFTVNGIVTLGNEFGDNIFLNGGIVSNILPSDSNTYDLGSSTYKWKDLYIDGTANVDTLTVNESASITQNLTVSGSLTANGNVNLGNEYADTVTIPGVLDVNGKANIDDVEISGTSIRCTAVSQNLSLEHEGNGGIVLQGGGLSIDKNGNVSTGHNTTLGNYFGVAGTDLDTVTFNSRIDSSILPNGTDTYSLGTGLTRWNAVHAEDGYFDKVQTNSNVIISGGLTVTGGNITCSGTGNKFIGDGSSLTGIDASTIQDSNSDTRAEATTTGVTITGDIDFNDGSGGFTGMLKEKFHQDFSNQISNTEIHLEDGNVQFFSAKQTGGLGTISVRYASGVNLGTKLADGEMVTLTILAEVTDGNSFYPDFALTIDGAQRTTYWVGGSLPTTGGNGTGPFNISIDVYNFTILKRNSGYNVIASQGITVP